MIPLFTLWNGTMIPLCYSVQVKKKVRRQSFDSATLHNLYEEMVTEKKFHVVQSERRKAENPNKDYSRLQMAWIPADIRSAAGVLL